ncbi:LacI family DNA-binding transcriptional regulator [Paenibacillus abyssi]|uniref:LacI family transcriptional regulator n=1 Tax=Paenibacillus abyssi TaxID=1340531 RepID=A0A917FNN5_9BACL|nr:LacI family DNA-binding transcriptional regulator [Paenibacillus abyssi]GGF96020.1 LacI family transcriptional regulator [Paenibacillus abyssi]
MSHTLESIAKLAGVSRGTVSRVVNNQQGVKPDVRDRVIKIIKETGYHPNAQARSLAGGKTENIGVVVFGNEANFLTHHIFYEVLQGIQNKVVQNQYDLLIFANRSERDHEYWKRIGDKRKVDGLIVMGENIREEYLLYYYEKKLPFVLVGKRHFHQVPLFCATSDYRNGAYEATKHLIEQGRRNIAFVRGYPDTYHEGEKLAGYQRALKEADLPLDFSLIIDGQARQEIARTQINNALGQGTLIDGIFAGNDLMAFGVIEALRDRGLVVPRDVSVVGYDDIQAAAYYNPKLTTVRQDKQALGERATELLLKLMRNELTEQEAGFDIMVDNQIMIRESSVVQ